MSKKVYAIITAAGSGARFKKLSKGSTPKQFLNLSGKPVILYSLLAFQKCKEINEIVVSTGREYFDYLHTLAAKNKINKLLRLVEGGKTRFESVKNAFQEIHGNKNDLILIHDAARPNITPRLIKKVLKETGKASGVILGCRVSETVKRDKNGYVTDTLPRENLWLIQTPQVFRYDVLRDAYKKCGRKNDFTDESALAESAGYKIKIIEGSKDNIKITTPDDIKLIKAFTR